MENRIMIALPFVFSFFLSSLLAFLLRYNSLSMSVLCLYTHCLVIIEKFYEYVSKRGQTWTSKNAKYKKKEGKCKKQMWNNWIVISILQHGNFIQKPEIGNHTVFSSSILSYIYLIEKQFANSRFNGKALNIRTLSLVQEVNSDYCFHIKKFFDFSLVICTRLGTMDIRWGVNKRLFTRYCSQRWKIEEKIMRKMNTTHGGTADKE